MKKKVLSIAMAAVIAFSGFAAVPVSAKDGNSNYGNSNYGNSNYSNSNYGDSDYGKKTYKTYKMKRVGKVKRTVADGDIITLKVKKKGALKDKHLKWTIKNKKVAKFKSKDRTNDVVKLKAKNPGTTKVICHNKKTGGKIVYTIKVKAPKKGNSNYGNSNYGNSNYGNSNYGNSNYGDSAYGN